MSDLKPIRNPYTGEIFAEVPFADKELLKKSLDMAVDGFEKMKTLPSYQRSSILEKMAEYINKNSEEIAKTLSLEAGKPIKLARGEVDRCVFTLKTASEEAKRMVGEVIPLDIHPTSSGRTGITRRFPIGVILGITPFNFPLNLVAHKVAPAIAGGNSIIIKPASATPLSALYLAKAGEYAEIPPGGFQVIPSSADNMEVLLKDERVKMLTFTGSAEVGWKLKADIPKKKTALELGGNGMVIVDSYYNLDYLVSRCIMGAFAYAGQVCISLQRIMIKEDLTEEFLSGFLNRIPTEALIGDPLDKKALLSSMITEKEAVRAEEWVNEAVSQGAVILTGGKREGSVYYPTVLTNVDENMKVCKDEIFAPVVTVEPYKDLNSAMEKVNRSRYGLQTGIFTTDLNKAFSSFEKIETGGLMINDVPTFRVDPMPYGGVKESGFGREGVKYAIEEMTEMRLMVIHK